LRFPAANELPKLADVTSISAEVVGAHRRGSRNAYGCSRNAAASTDAADSAATTTASPIAATEATAAGRSSTFTALAEAEDGFPTGTATATTTLSTTRATTSRGNGDATDEG
jgi:hypothetical protein